MFTVAKDAVGSGQAAKDAIVTATGKWFSYFSTIDRAQKGLVRHPRFALENVNDGKRMLSGEKELSVYNKFRQAIAEDLAEKELPGTAQTHKHVPWPIDSLFDWRECEQRIPRGAPSSEYGQATLESSTLCSDTLTLTHALDQRCHCTLD